MCINLEYISDQNQTNTDGNNSIDKVCKLQRHKPFRIKLKVTSMFQDVECQQCCHASIKHAQITQHLLQHGEYLRGCCICGGVHFLFIKVTQLQLLQRPVAPKVQNTAELTFVLIQRLISLLNLIVLTGNCDLA